MSDTPRRRPVTRLVGTRGRLTLGAAAGDTTAGNDAVGPRPSDPHRRRRLVPVAVVAALAGLVLLLDAVVGSDDEARPVPSAPAAVDMPVPYGTEPVEPVRVLLVLGDSGFPARERVALAEWISRTQHTDTRVRLQRRERLSAPMSARDLLVPPSLRTVSDRAAGRWLEAGARQAVPGVALGIGAAAPAIAAPAYLRSATVPFTAADRFVHHKLASGVARQIMVTARQGERPTR